MLGEAEVSCKIKAGQAGGWTARKGDHRESARGVSSLDSLLFGSVVVRYRVDRARAQASQSFADRLP